VDRPFEVVHEIDSDADGRSPATLRRELDLRRAVLAALELDAARSVSNAPIRGAVNTDYHYDHTFGNSYYRSRNIDIIGHQQVETLMRTVYGSLKGKDSRILLFNGMYPFAIDSQMVPWRRIVDHLLRYGRGTRFVPGHGALCGVDAVQTMADVMDDLRLHAERMLKAGLPVGEAQRRYVVPPRFESLAIVAWGFTVAAAIDKYCAELPREAGASIAIPP
jgi:metallo-beta-lactamase superfamily protein